MPLRRTLSSVVVLAVLAVLVACILQRPTAKQLLKHKFVAKAKKPSYLIDLIERYRKWKENGGKADSDSDSDSDDDREDGEMEEFDWEFGTIKSAPKALDTSGNGVCLAVLAFLAFLCLALLCLALPLTHSGLHLFVLVLGPLAHTHTRLFFAILKSPGGVTAERAAVDTSCIPARGLQSSAFC